MQHRLRWDEVLALGYAAEQLFIAGQLLTSDVVPVEQAVHAACERHIGRLLRVRPLLPSSLVRQLELCFSQCPPRATLTREQAQELGQKTLRILEELRRVLNEVAEQEDRNAFPDAA